jgi:TPR repeat protein
MARCEICETKDAETFCPQCHESFCKTCLDFTHQSKTKNQHLLMCTPMDQIGNWTCSLHSKDIDALCEECEELVCFDCCIKGGYHMGHSIFQLKDSVDAMNRIKTRYITQLKKLNDRNEISLENMKNERNLLVNRLRTIEHDSTNLALAMSGFGSKLQHKETCGAIQSIIQKPENSPWNTKEEEYLFVKNSFESKVDISKPSGVLLDILMYRKAVPKKIMEIAVEKCMLTQAFHAEAQMEMFGKTNMFNTLKKLMKNPRSQEDHVGLALAHFYLEEYEVAFTIFSKFDHIPFVQSILGKMYEKGHYVKVNNAMAFELYSKAAESSSEAKSNLSFCYFKGIGVQRDPIRAVKYLQASVDEGFVRAIHDLAVCYANGVGVAQSKEEAFQLFKRSSLLGYPKSQYKLGSCYENGIGVEKSDLEAFRWYNASALGNFRDAQCTVGVFYERGVGCIKNVQSAVEWYEKAALQDYPLAQYNLGVCYLNGIGVPQDNSKARIWFRKAAVHGHEGANNQMELLE